MERRGFPGCPRQISRLDERSVVLSYMRGHAISDPPPPWATQKRTLRLVTRFLRSFSDASAGIRKEIEHADWLAPPLSAGDYLVHGDPHPTNLIFNRLRQPTAIIDFELATVGSDDWNLISLMFCWGPLEPLEATFWKNLSARFEIDERLAAILEMWDSPSSSSELVEAGRDFLEWRQRWIRRLAGAGNPGARAFLGSANFDARFAFAEARLKHALR
ncbi:phosphotransferase [Kribbella soli]